MATMTHTTEDAATADNYFPTADPDVPVSDGALESRQRKVTVRELIVPCQLDRSRRR